MCVFGSPSNFSIIFCKVTNWLALSFTDFTVYAWPFTAQSLQHFASLRSFTFLHSRWLVFVLQSSSATATSSNSRTHTPTYNTIINGIRTKKKWKRVVKLQHEVWFRCMAFLKYMAGRFSFIWLQKQKVFCCCHFCCFIHQIDGDKPMLSCRRIWDLLFFFRPIKVSLFIDNNNKPICKCIRSNINYTELAS